MTLPLRSPLTGRALEPDTAWSLSDGAGERWPLLDGIAYLRTGRAALAAAALERLDAGDRNGALALLLGDQDDWWPGPAADPDRLVALVRDADNLSFRAAMDHLGFGRVGDYLAHRWSDPTFIAGLALMEAHWAAPATAFELACGAGQYLRELALRGVVCTGVDVVFAKLWLARHWVCGADVALICCDAASRWPVAGEEKFDLVLCHDALYFLEPKPAIVSHLRALLADGGQLSVAHVHNRDAANLSTGAAIDAADLQALVPDATVYDDADLTRALAESRAPRPQPWSALGTAEAFSFVVGAGAARPIKGGLALPAHGQVLVKNPLYSGDAIAWPSDRYRDEYAPRATYPAHSKAPARAQADPTTEAMARSRELVALPERW